MHNETHNLAAQKETSRAHLTTGVQFVSCVLLWRPPLCRILCGDRAVEREKPFIVLSWRLPPLAQPLSVTALGARGGRCRCAEQVVRGPLSNAGVCRTKRSRYRRVVCRVAPVALAVLRQGIFLADDAA